MNPSELLGRVAAMSGQDARDERDAADRLDRRLGALAGSGRTLQQTLAYADIAGRRADTAAARVAQTADTGGALDEFFPASPGPVAKATDQRRSAEVPDGGHWVVEKARRKYLAAVVAEGEKATRRYRAAAWTDRRH